MEPIESWREEQMFEVEQKFEVNDLPAIRQRILDRFTECENSVSRQSDAYLMHPCRDFRVTGEAFRVRQVDRRLFVTYKGPRQLDTSAGKTTKTRREIEIELNLDSSQFDQALELYLHLGFREIGRVVKHREQFTTDVDSWPVAIFLDQVQDLGDFVEIEVITGPQRLSAGQNIVRNLAAELGLHNAITTSYLEMILAR